VQLGRLLKGDVILNGNFKKDFVLGLDLAGGAALTYTVDTKALPEGTNVEESVTAPRPIIKPANKINNPTKSKVR
jgi:preprotein translocase subunit SecD